jgi:hypothetical protein
MRLSFATIALAAMLATVPPFASSGAEPSVRLITLDPGHFHAGLVQKFMYPQVSPVVYVYAPGGPELEDHLNRVQSFNTRAENPTRWEEKVYTGKDFLDRMLRERRGNVVVISATTPKKNNLHSSTAASLSWRQPMALDHGASICSASFSTRRRIRCSLRHHDPSATKSLNVAAGAGQMPECLAPSVRQPAEPP